MKLTEGEWDRIRIFPRLRNDQITWSVMIQIVKLLCKIAYAQRSKDD